MINISRIVALTILCMALCASVHASPVVLTDPVYPNSTVRIDPYTQAGLYDWVVESFDQMTQNGFYYRIGDTGVATPFSSIGAIGVSQPNSTYAILSYTGDAFDAEVHYVLYGGDLGSGTSDVSETVFITNKSGSALDFHLFEYMNLDMNGTAANDFAVIIPGPGGGQTDNFSTFATISLNPIVSHYEVGDAAALLGKINTTSGLTLADLSGPYLGDAGLAFQWDMAIAAGGSAMTSQDNFIIGAPSVPEANVLMLAISGLGLIPLRRRFGR